MANNAIGKLYALINEIETAMFTTRRSDSLLVSRPMATQARAAGADLWFVTSKGSPKLDEIRSDPHVNLAYFKNRTKEWISVSGVARIVHDRAKIAELYRPDWRMWFGSEGGGNDGTPDDPRIVLIGVDVKLAMYLEVNKPMPVVMFDVIKGLVTGSKPDVGEPRLIRK